MSEAHTPRQVTSAWRTAAAILSGAILLIAAVTFPASAQNQAQPTDAGVASIETWEKRLDDAGAAADYERAAQLMTGPIIEAAKPGISGTVANWLRDAFGDTGFRADTISVMSTAEKGERRLFALFHETKYAFLFMVFHKPDDRWVVLNFSLEPNYPAIRQRF